MKNLILLLLITLFATSCNLEKKFVKFHVKQSDKSRDYCIAWFPVKESVKEIIRYKAGEKIIIPGETEFVSVNCDSIVQAELDNASKRKIKATPTIVRVPVYRQVDTVYKDREVTVRDTRYENKLTDSIVAINAQKEKISNNYTSAKKARNIFGFSLIGLLLFIGITWYVKK